MKMEGETQAKEKMLNADIIQYAVGAKRESGHGERNEHAWQEKQTSMVSMTNIIDKENMQKETEGLPWKLKW